MNCIHQPQGLCPSCQSDYDTDPDAWFEFGFHPAGIANWERLQEELAAMGREPVYVPDDSIPF